MIPHSPTPVITIPDEFLLAMGKVTVVWGVLESIIDISLYKLGGFGNVDARGAIMTAHMPFPQKMDVLEALSKHLAPDYPHLAQFSSVKPLLKKAQEGRNRIAHGNWGYENGVVSRGRATARGQLKISVEPITIAEIEAILLDIHKAGIAVIDLVLKKR